MPEPTTPQLRRVITAIGEDGRSRIAMDGPPSSIKDFGGGVGLFEIWQEAQRSIDRRSTSDAGAGPVMLGPRRGQGGFKVRWFTIGPAHDDADPEETRAFYAQAFADIGGADCRPDTSRHPGMHLTPTVDVIIILDGRVRLLLDDDECELGPGDVVVQRGTNHAWVAVGDRPALAVAVLADAAFRDAAI